MSKFLKKWEYFLFLKQVSKLKGIFVQFTIYKNNIIIFLVHFLLD